MAEKFIRVRYDSQLFVFGLHTSLSEITDRLSSGNIDEQRRIRLSLLSDQNPIVIGDDSVLRDLAERSEGHLELEVKLRQASAKSLRRPIPGSLLCMQTLPHVSKSVDPAASVHLSSFSVSRQINRDLQELPPARITSCLRCKVAVNGAVLLQYAVELPKLLRDMTLFEVSQTIVEMQGLNASEYTCYLYNNAGWPLTINAEHMHLIKADFYLVDNDAVFGVITQERPPLPLLYLDPEAGNHIYCFRYCEQDFYIRLFPNCTVRDLKRKLVSKLRIPIDTISVRSLDDMNTALSDDFQVSEDDISTKRMKIGFQLSGKHIGKVDDLTTGLAENDLRKRYGYLYLLQKNVSPSLKNSLILLCYLLGQTFQPFLYAIYLALSDSNLTKSERVSLAFGCSAMFSSFSQLVSEPAAKDFSLMLGLLHKVAAVLNDSLSSLLTVIECAEVDPERLWSSSFSDKAKAEWLVGVTSCSHTTVPLLVTNIDNRAFREYLSEALPRVCLTHEELTAFIREVPYLTILHPLDITSSSVHRLTFHPSGDLWVTRGLEESCHEIGLNQKAILVDVLTEREEIIPRSQLFEDVRGLISSELRAFVISREPEEAVAVVIDTSGSMAAPYSSDDTHSRMEAAKIFFSLFAQKTMTYNYPHVFTLCTFGDASSVPAEFTDNMNRFIELVQDLKPHGETTLFSAMETGITRLVKFKLKYRRVALRMIVVSDGEDNSSGVTARMIADHVNHNNITVDVFAVGEKCSLLKLVAKRSGGYCYYTKTIIDGVWTFEAETIVKAGLRRQEQRPDQDIQSDEEFRAEAEKQKVFDTDPPPMKDSSILTSKVCSSSRAIQLQLSRNVTNPSAARRVQRELVRYSHDSHPDFGLFPLSTNLFVWRGVVEGPIHTPYEQGLFDFYITFGDGYPGKAPEMRFLTPIWHPNVTPNGKICHPIFNASYKSDTSVRDILNSVYSLLQTNELDDYVVSNLHITLKYDREQFEAKATEWTRLYALRTKSKEQLIKEMMIEDDCPEKYKCAYSGVIMRSPVYCAKSDKLYERSAIEAYIREHGKDPNTGIPISLGDLSDEVRLKQEINRLYPV